MENTNNQNNKCTVTNIQKNYCLYTPNLWDSIDMTHAKMFRSFQRMDVKGSGNFTTDKNYPMKQLLHFFPIGTLYFQETFVESISLPFLQSLHSTIQFRWYMFTYVFPTPIVFFHSITCLLYQCLVLLAVLCLFRIILGLF